MVPLCPVCNEPLLIYEFQGVEIDSCPQCLGIWLDEGELELVAQSEPADVLARYAEGVDSSRQPRRSGAAESARRASGRDCPRCSRTLVELHPDEAALPRLNRCPQGHGLWFDQGELRQLLASLGPVASGSLALLKEFFGTGQGEATKHEPSKREGETNDG